jgi:hypothetical protein
MRYGLAGGTEGVAAAWSSCSLQKKSVFIRVYQGSIILSELKTTNGLGVKLRYPEILPVIVLLKITRIRIIRKGMNYAVYHYKTTACVPPNHV